MATGSAVVYWHGATGPDGGRLPWSKVSTVALADLQPVTGDAYAPITEKMPCKGLYENEAFPCIVLVVSKGEDVNELRRNYFTIEQERRLVDTGRRWAAELEVQKAAMVVDAPPSLADAAASGSNAQAASVVVGERQSGLVARNSAAEVSRLVVQALPFGLRRGGRKYPVAANRDHSFSPEIDAPSDRVTEGLSATTVRTRGRAVYPLRMAPKVNVASVNRALEAGVKKNRKGGKLPSLFSPRVPVPPVSTWKIVNNVDVAEFQKEVNLCPSWKSAFKKALYKFYSMAELHSPDATAYLIDQTRLQVVVGLVREFCVKENEPLPSGPAMSNAFCYAKYM